MGYKIEMKEEAAQPVLAVRFRSSVEELPDQLGRIYGNIICYIQKAGGTAEKRWHEINQYIIVVIGYIIRTALEDSFLQKNLTGYRDYTWTVRYRLIPGVW